MQQQIPPNFIVLSYINMELGRGAAAAAVPAKVLTIGEHLKCGIWCVCCAGRASFATVRLTPFRVAPCSQNIYTNPRRLKCAHDFCRYGPWVLTCAAPSQLFLTLSTALLPVIASTQGFICTVPAQHVGSQLLQRIQRRMHSSPASSMSIVACTPHSVVRSVKVG
jgi:hypothetical protein